MDLDFTEEQNILRHSISSVCNDFANFEILRSIEDTETGFSKDFWNKLIELGITGIAIPEKYGGSGMGLLDAAIIYEELGRSLALAPHFISSYVSANLINDLGDDHQKSELLPPIASGQIILTLGWLEEGSTCFKSGINLKLEKKKDFFVINGIKTMVPYASSADKIILFLRDEEDIRAGIIDLNQKGIHLSYEYNHAKTSMFSVEFDGVEIHSSAMLGNGDIWSVWESITHRCQVLLAAEATGGSERSLYIGRDYSLEREAFGQKIGGFQSIAHYLADGLVEVEANKLMTYQTAWAHDDKQNIATLSAMTKLQCCNSFRDISATTIQIFGGMGFTIEADPQLFYRRAKHLQNFLWDSDYLEKQLENNFFK